MSDCINPSCPGNRDNPDLAQFCQFCSTPLTIEGNRGHRYRLIKPLSYGHPYTEIFKAIDLKDQQTKVFKTLKNSSPKLVELFQREADLLLRLKHPAIPHYEDYFEFLVPAAQNQLLRCLVMEYFEGVDLEQWVQDKGKLDETTAIDWLKQIAIVLGYVHGKGCFHRDIKPSNLLRKATITGKDELALIDFGIARETEKTLVNGHHMTIAYTSGYAPPEQAQGKALPQSDFYALGRTFMHLLTGLSPNDPHLDLANWNWATNCPNSRLIPLIDRMTQDDPNQRPQSVEEILQAIDQLSQPNVVVAASPASPTVSSQLHSASSHSSPRASLNSFFKPSVSLSSTQSSTQSSTRSLSTKSFRFKPWMFLLLGAIALIGGIGRMAYCRSNPAACGSVLGESFSPSNLRPVDRLISTGEQPIEEVDPALQLTESEPYGKLMEQGMQLFYDGQDYNSAAEQFKQIRITASEIRAKTTDPNERGQADRTLRNPLPLIYEGNATARQRSKDLGQPIYSIGVAVPLNTAPGVDTLRGVALMQQKAIAAYGINIEFVLANDRNIPAQSKAIAEALVKRPGILAVIGHYTSSNTCAGLSVYDPANLVLISPVSTVLNLRSNCSTTRNQVFFRTTSSTAVEAATLIRYLGEPQGLNKANPRVAVFYNPEESDDPKTAFSPDLTEQFTTQLRANGGEVVKEAIDLSDPNFDAEAALQDVQDADALAILPDGRFDQPAFQNAVKLIEANRGEKVILGANTVYSQEVFDQVRQQAGDRALGNRLIMAVEWQQQCGAPDFLEEVDRTYVGGGINRRTALAYEAAQVLVEQIRRNPNINPAQMQAALAGSTPIQSDVVNNTISFSPNGDREEYDSRLLVTLARQNNQLQVVPLNTPLNGQCQPS